ncbi:MAG: hypothetical protein QXS11_06005 [Zestosphaera sp.]
MGITIKTEKDLTEIEKYLFYPETTPRKLYDVGFLRVVAVTLVLIGLTGIYLVSYYAPTPVMPISQLVGNFLMNYATVYIEGVVVEPPRAELQAGGKVRITLYVSDGSTDESFTIFVYDPTSTELLKMNKVPMVGDRVRILVQVRVREDFTYAYLQDARSVYIYERPGGEPVFVNNLSNVSQFQYVCANGLVSNPRIVSSGLLLNLDTRAGSVTVLVPNILQYMYANSEVFSSLWGRLQVARNNVTVCGVVYYYRGTSPEIVPRSIEEIRVESLAEEAKEIDISELPAYVGKYVTLTGRLTKLGYDSPTYMYLLYLSSDESGAQAVGLCDRSTLVTTIDPWSVGVGSKLRVYGLVRSESIIELINMSVIEVVQPPSLTISEALQEAYGTIVILRNVIVRNSYTTSGGSWQIDVEDSTGSIRIFVPSSVARGTGISIPGVNTVISVAGYRDVYGSLEEVVVFSENGIRIEAITTPTTPPPTPAFIPIEISQVSQYIDKNVSFVGVFSKIKYVSGVYYVEFTSLDGYYAVNVTMSRSQLASNIDPVVVGWKSVFRINGTVRDATTVTLFSVKLIELKSPLVVSVEQALSIGWGVPVMLINVTVVSSRSTSGNDWQIYVTDPSNKTILVFVPRSVVSELEFSLPTQGTLITVAGYRDVYGSTEEIIVYSVSGLIVK